MLQYVSNMRKQASPVAALVSGGLDSAVLVSILLKRYPKVQPIYVQQGCRWESAERYWLSRWLRHWPRKQVLPLMTLVIPVSDLYGHHWSLNGKAVPKRSDPDEAVYLPGRNLMLLSKAAIYCALHDIPRLAVGTLKGNPFSDAKPQFWCAMEQSFQKGLGVRVKILAPLAKWSKAEVIKRGRQLPLEETFSCIDPKGKQPCGICQKCQERRKGFEIAESR